MEQQLLTLLEHMSSPQVFSGVRITRSLVLCVYFVDRCLSFCFFFFWPLCCLLFFDLRIMITPLVSSKSSYLNLSVYIEYNLSTVIFRYCREWTKLFRGFHYIYFILNYNFSANYPEVNSYRILIIASF